MIIDTLPEQQRYLFIFLSSYFCMTVSLEEIITEVFDGHASHDSVYTLIGYLKQSLKGSNYIIKNLRGHGYMLTSKDGYT